MDLTRLGKLIRGRRIRLGIKAEAVAKAAGVSRAYLSMLETGRDPKTGKASKPSIEVLALLSTALRLDLRELMRSAGYPKALVESVAPQAKGYQSRRQIEPLQEKIDDLRRELKRAKLLYAGPSHDETPSGITGFRTRIEDHVLLLTESKPGRDNGLIRDFVAAGLRHRETCLVCLGPSSHASRVMDSLRGRVSEKDIERLAVVPWSEVVPHYRDRRYSRRAGLKADSIDLRKLPAGPWPTIRLATSDASDYFAWVRNPKEVLKSENCWASDLHRIRRGTNFLLLCLYRMSDLRKREKPDFPLTQMLLGLLESHNRVVFLTGSKTLFDREAVTELIPRMDLRVAGPEVWNQVRAIGDRHGVWNEED